MEGSSLRISTSIRRLRSGFMARSQVWSVADRRPNRTDGFIAGLCSADLAESPESSILRDGSCDATPDSPGLKVPTPELAHNRVACSNPLRLRLNSLSSADGKVGYQEKHDSFSP